MAGPDSNSPRIFDIGSHDLSPMSLSSSVSTWRDCGPTNSGTRVVIAGGTGFSCSESGELKTWTTCDQSGHVVSIGEFSELARLHQVEAFSLQPAALMISDDGNTLAVASPSSAVEDGSTHVFSVFLLPVGAQSVKESQHAQIELEGTNGQLCPSCCHVGSEGTKNITSALSFILGGESWFATFQLSRSRSSDFTDGRLRSELIAFRSCLEWPLSCATLLRNSSVITLSVTGQCFSYDSPALERCRFGSRLSEEGVSFFTTALEGSIVVLGGRGGTVVACNSAGAELWFFRAANTLSDPVTSLFVSAPMLFVGYASGLVLHVDMNTEAGLDLPIFEHHRDSLPVHGFVLTRRNPTLRTLSWMTFAQGQGLINEWDPEHLVGQGLEFTEVSRNLEDGKNLLAAGMKVYSFLDAARLQLIEVGATHAISFVSETLASVSLLSLLACRISRQVSFAVPSGLIVTLLDEVNDFGETLAVSLKNGWLGREAANPRLQRRWWEKIVLIMRDAQKVVEFMRRCAQQLFEFDLWAKHWREVDISLADSLPVSLHLSWADVNAHLRRAGSSEGTARLFRSALDPFRLGSVVCTRLSSTQDARISSKYLSVIPGSEDPWFFGFLSPREAVLVLSREENGSFIAHWPGSQLYEFCVSYKAAGSISHILIDILQDEKPQCRIREVGHDQDSFSSIAELITQYSFCLLHPVPRPDGVDLDCFSGDLSGSDLTKVFNNVPAGSFLLRLCSQGLIALSFTQNDGQIMSLLIKSKLEATGNAREETRRLFYVAGAEEMVFPAMSEIVRGYRENQVLSESSVVDLAVQAWRLIEEEHRVSLEATVSRALIEAKTWETRGQVWSQAQLAALPTSLVRAVGSTNNATNQLLTGVEPGSPTVCSVCHELREYVSSLRERLAVGPSYDECVALSLKIRELSQYLDKCVVEIGISMDVCRSWVMEHYESLDQRETIPADIRSDERRVKLISVGGLVAQKIIGVLAFFEQVDVLADSLVHGLTKILDFCRMPSATPRATAVNEWERPTGVPQPRPSVVPKPAGPEVGAQPAALEFENTSISAGKSTFADDAQKSERLRQKAIEEMVSSESEYVQDLNDVLAVWLYPLRLQKVVSDMDLTAVFGNIETLINVNAQLLREWSAQISNPIHEHGDLAEAIGTAFNQILPYLKMYTTYCAGYPKAVIHFSDLQRKNKEFARVLKVCDSDPRVKGLSLLSYLIKPVQRLCKYPLLFRELLRHTPPDHPSLFALKATEDQLSEVVEYVNERKREAEDLQKIVDIQNTLSVPSNVTRQLSHMFSSNLSSGEFPREALTGSAREGFNLVGAARRFVADGELKCAKRGAMVPMKVWLFSDALVLGAPIKQGGARSLQQRMSLMTASAGASNCTTTHELKALVPLAIGQIVDIGDSPGRTNLIEIHSAVVNGKSFKKPLIWQMQCEDPLMKTAWLKHLKGTKKELQQELFEKRFGKREEKIQTRQRESLRRELASADNSNPNTPNVPRARHVTDPGNQWSEGPKPSTPSSGNFADWGTRSMDVQSSSSSSQSPWDGYGT